MDNGEDIAMCVPTVGIESKAIFNIKGRVLRVGITTPVTVPESKALMVLIFHDENKQIFGADKHKNSYM